MAIFTDKLVIPAGIAGMLFKAYLKLHHPIVLSAIFFAFAPAAWAIQTDIIGPVGSGQFGASVIALPNGNFVVVDALFDDGAVVDVGAVHLYDGATLALISTLKGSTTGDAVGGSSGVHVLANGNFVVRSPNWDNGASGNVGAVTWCSASTGCNGPVSVTNSLIGGTAGDQVGLNFAILANGNYVVGAGLWDNPAGPVADAGAVTWCNGTTGRVGLVTAATSLVGGAAGNFVGSGVMRALTNGNYVVASPSWDNPSGPVTDVGAVTWGNGATGLVGVVGISNSLVGSTTSDLVGSAAGGASITPLTNGHYVVRSTSWDNASVPASDAGAATWCNGSGGTVGAVSSTNSLVGGSNSDSIGNNGLTALTNGNYVVISPFWREPTTPVSNAGAVTWGNGLGGTTGLVSASNSLIGGRSLDRIGINGVIALTNGNYVVNSPGWDNPVGPVSNVGASTWGNGSGGTVGPVTTINSLVGGRDSDAVGSISVALSNGHYVTSSQSWDNPTGPVNSVGAATWCNGTTGRTGLVTTANSLTGSKSSDAVGVGITALTNGNYVVRSSGWLNASFVPVGAATLGSGASGTTGVISAANSLVGSTNNDGISSHGVTALANGNYVVNSSQWNAPGAAFAGAVTWANGSTGLIAAVSSSNSLVGAASDGIGGVGGAAALANGNYVLNSPGWDNPAGPYTNAGAVTLGNGTTGTVGTFTAANTVAGTVATGGGGQLVYAFDDARNYLIVGRPASNIVTILSNSSFAATGAGNFNAPATWGGTSPGGLDTAVVPPGITVTVPSAGNNFAGLVSVNGTLNGPGTLNGNLGANSGGTIAPGTSPGVLTVNGNATLKSGSTYVAEINGTTVGTLYDQLKVNGTVMLDNPTLSVTFGFAPVIGNTFRLIDNDGTDPIAGTFNGISEGSFLQISGSTVAYFSYRGGDGNDFVVSVTIFSAATTTVSGRVTTANGNGITNALVNLIDQGGVVKTARTGSFGYYRFDNVETGQIYIIDVTSKRYVFAPRTITVADELTDIDFISK